MIKITTEIVKTIHDGLISNSGGTLGVLDEGTIDCVVARINAQTDVFKKATWALYIAKLHPFYDGQKRTAFTLACVILKEYEYYLSKNDEDEIFDALHKIARYECRIKDIERWLKKKSRKWWKANQRKINDYL